MGIVFSIKNIQIFVFLLKTIIHVTVHIQILLTIVDEEALNELAKNLKY